MCAYEHHYQCIVLLYQHIIAIVYWLPGVTSYRIASQFDL